MKIHELIEKDNGNLLYAAKDDKVQITLAWKPSSGFVWQEGDGEAGTLERVEHPGENPTPGASAVVKFIFRLVKTGLITLSYARPWDEQNQPTKWFVVNVMIRPSTDQMV